MNNNPKKYFITLTPVGKYFFGSDMKFRTGNKATDNKFASYIIESMQTPQQTSLLGMLRFLLLSNDSDLFDTAQNQIKKDALTASAENKKNPVEVLIGATSFTVNDNEKLHADNIQKELHGLNDYGKIRGIGPCFIYRKTDGKAFFPRKVNDDMSLSFDASTKAYINGEERTLPTIKVKKKKDTATNVEWEDFSGKYFIDTKWIAADGTSLEEKEIFVKDTRIGIDKNPNGKANNEGFYKQISYRLKEGFCFAFEATIDNIDISNYDGQIVTVGADASAFVLNVYEPTDKQISEKTYRIPTSQQEAKHQVILISDAYIPADTLNDARYAITDIRPFRFLHTPHQEDAKKYNAKYHNLLQNKRYDLYKAGSIFFFDTAEQADGFCSALKDLKEFHQIGYNHTSKHYSNQ